MAAAKKDFSIQQRVCEPIVNRGLESLRRIHFLSIEGALPEDDRGQVAGLFFGSRGGLGA